MSSMSNSSIGGREHGEVEAGLFGAMKYWTWLVSVSMLAATLYGFGQLIGPGPFDWHIEQPEFIEGGIELLVVGAITFVVVRWTRPLLGLALTLLVSLVFLRNHGVDVAALAACTYCVGLLMVGDLIAPRIGVEQHYPFRRLALAAVAGLSVVATISLLWTFAFGLSFEGVRTLLIVICLVGACVWVRRDDVDRMPQLAMSRPGTAAAFIIALVVICSLAVMARSNHVLYYDSIWYGARPDRVLFGPTGFYDWLGLTTQVHYYPKLYELVLAPLQGWGDQSGAIAFGLASWLFLFAAVQALGIGMGLTSTIAALVACVVLCTPAALGNAETTKGDLAALAFVTFALVALVNAIRRRRSEFLVDVLVFALIASCLRLSVLPYLGVLFIASVTVTLWLWVRAPRAFLGELWTARRALLMITCVVAFLLVHLRTYSLTGTPFVTTAGIQDLFDRFGMMLRFPIGAFTASGEPVSWTDVFSVVPATALTPHELRFHTAKWMGAAWFVLLVMVGWVALLRARRDAGFMLVFGIGLLFPVLIAALTWQVRGGDGNYFLLSIAAFTVTGVALLDRRSRLLMACMCTVALVGVGAYFMGSNWVQGSRTFDLRFDHVVRDEPEQVERFLATSGLADLAALLASCNPHLRATGMLPTPAAFALPVRYEPLEEMAWNNRASFASDVALLQLLAATGTDLVLLPDESRRADLNPELVELVERVSVHAVDRGIAIRGVDIAGYRAYWFVDRDSTESASAVKSSAGSGVSDGRAHCAVMPDRRS
jgi:hypothetical protein